MRYIKSREEQISQSFNRLANEYTCSLEDINNGFCDEISYNDVIIDVIGKKNYINLSSDAVSEPMINTVYEIDDGLFWSEKPSKYHFNGDYWNIENLNRFGVPPFDLELLNTFILKGHVWIYYNGLHYDAEASQGVDNFWKLPIYQRQLKSLSIKEDRFLERDTEKYKNIWTSDIFRMELIDLFLEKVKHNNLHNIETPNYTKLIDDWDGYDDQVYIQNDLTNNQIIFWEGWVKSCWDAAYLKEEYKKMNKEDVIEKIITERFPRIGYEFNLQIIKYEYFKHKGKYIMKIIFNI